MTELLNSYTFEAKKIVYYSVTVGADNKTEAKRIAWDCVIVMFIIPLLICWNSYQE